jgi:hypothetical protein
MVVDIQKLYLHRTPEEVIFLLAKASNLAKEKPALNWYEIQNELKIGAQEAYLIFDWLADQHATEPFISTHWLRCGRTYVLNNPFPSLAGMSEMLRVGERRSYLIMQELERKGLIRIKPDFGFDRVGRMSSFKDLIRQLKVIAKKYRGRCEPVLLIRKMYIDPVTALRLAQYGEENLGLRWKDRERVLM